MKKLFYLFMVALCATMFTACSDDDDKDPLNEEEEGGEGVITMVVEEDYVYYLYVDSFKEGEIITIDWGDGTVEKFKTVLWYDGYEKYNEIHYWTDELEHKYSNSNPHLITIKGNIKELTYEGRGLTSLDVSKCPELRELGIDCDLTSLDVSKNTKLMVLWCPSNNLASLDVSKNTKLTELYCNDNELTSLDISKNKELILLDCGDNNFSSSALNKIFYDLPKGRDVEYDEYEIAHSTIWIEDNPGTNTCDRSIAEKKGWDIVDRLY
ncbi:hypothetical protein [Odoribacter lunatus]|uniref:hypothetical protein n=1 Tax=Odoribacter lunatus TaxID=2941335 RepID=UPI00203E4CE6|nr:hypothetical protein [Odoribacter lunatus]